MPAERPPEGWAPEPAPGQAPEPVYGPADCDHETWQLGDQYATWIADGVDDEQERAARQVDLDAQGLAIDGDPHICRELADHGGGVLYVARLTAAE